VLGTAFSTDGRFLVSCSRDRTLKLTEVRSAFIDNVTSITPAPSGRAGGGGAATVQGEAMVKAANIAVASTERRSTTNC
jgi:hypothetical protein